MTIWTDYRMIFGIKDISWANRQARAPDCIERNEKYYFYFPARGRTGVAVADSPAGPFNDALGGRPLIPIKGIIDLCPFVDEDGQAYLYFGGYNRLSLVKLKEDMITSDGPIRPVNMPDYQGGIWVHKRNGFYYASYPIPGAHDKTTNRLAYSMATNPLGPWQHKGVILDNHSWNVHGSITGFKDQWYLIYHVVGPGACERRACLERLFYKEDATINPLEISKVATPKGAQPGKKREPRRHSTETFLNTSSDLQ